MRRPDHLWCSRSGWAGSQWQQMGRCRGSCQKCRFCWLTLIPRLSTGLCSKYLTEHFISGLKFKRNGQQEQQRIPFWILRAIGRICNFNMPETTGILAGNCAGKGQSAVSRSFHLAKMIAFCPCGQYREDIQCLHDYGDTLMIDGSTLSTHHAR